METIEERLNSFDMKLIGEGSYASVYKYKDTLYNCFFAMKKLKKATTEKEKERFRHEFELLSKYDHPNILKAYRYIDSKDSYIMEYCDYTLKQYFDKKGNLIENDKRKDIALQFLNALKILHNDELLHRDISYNNILIKQYNCDKITIKISDFGLIKEKNSDLTSIGTSIKGTIIDDTLGSFKDYNLKNEIYSIGIILFYIFTGKQNLENYNDSDKKLLNIINRCIDRNHNNRYNSVDEIISDVYNMFDEDKEIFNNIMTDSYIKVNSPIIDNNGLNELSYEILKNAVDGDGNILYIRSLSGLSIQSGNKSYNPNNAREEAELENAIDVLENNSYIKATDYKRDFFKVTKAGYDYFEQQVVYV